MQIIASHILMLAQMEEQEMHQFLENLHKEKGQREMNWGSLGPQLLPSSNDPLLFFIVGDDASP